MRFSSITLLLALGCTGPLPAVELCDDDADNDDDGFVDCGDQDCWLDAACAELSCDDGLDNDYDGRIDCADPDCAAACTPEGCVGDCVEDCSNGVDDDLDFLVDCADPECGGACDGDGDGWNGLGGPDCDDTRADVNPDQEETPYDGIDNDCDEDTPDDDVDGDGFLLADDCDDAAAETYPGAPETCGNGRLDDCDAVDAPSIAACFGTRSFATADARVVSPTADGWLGWSLASMGDLDDDGVPELLIGAYGETAQAGAALVVTPAAGVVDAVAGRAKLTGESEQDWAGYSVANGQQQGYGEAADLLIGTPYDDRTDNNSGCVYVVDGGTVDTVDLRSSPALLVGERSGDQFGYAVSSAGDVDGDGMADLIVGAPLEGMGDLGAAYVYLGPLAPTTHQVGAAYTKIRGLAPDDQLGNAVLGGHDLDGDGMPELLVAARFQDTGGQNAGAVYIFRSVLGLAMDPTNADAAAVGLAPDERSGTALAVGDFDGDGLGDLVVGAPGALSDAGVVRVYRGNVDGILVPFAEWIGKEPAGLAGTAVAVADVNGDGNDDLVIGAPGVDGVGTDSGAVYIVFGPMSGSTSRADVVIEGSGAFGFAGQAVLGVPDWTGDGRDEVVIGAPFLDGAGPASGEVAVFWWGW